jgi:hypothetical protein
MTLKDIEKLKKFKWRTEVLAKRPNERVSCLFKENIWWNDYGTSDMLYEQLMHNYLGLSINSL